MRAGVQIQRNFFQAEFGNSPAIINVAAEVVSNASTAQLFEFLRNDAMDARNFFSSRLNLSNEISSARPVGGFIKRDKLFFFGNFESFRQRLGVIQRGIYPTQQLLSGDFTGQPTIYDPLTFDPTTGTRQAFPGNRIPANRINQVSKNFFPYIPVTNNPIVNGANLTGTPVQKPERRSNELPRGLDHQSEAAAFGRYSWQKLPSPRRRWSRRAMRPSTPRVGTSSLSWIHR